MADIDLSYYVAAADYDSTTESDMCFPDARLQVTIVSVYREGKEMPAVTSVESGGSLDLENVELF